MSLNKIKHFYFNKYVVTPLSKRTYYLCYNFSYRALWFRVAKVGSRTIDQHFRDHSPQGSYIYSSEVGYLPTMYRDFLKFAFVRHPADRLKSAWKNKVLEANYFHFPPVEYEKMKELAYFVGWVEKLDVSQCDEHLRLQSSLIDLNHVDFIGRFENFAEDFTYLAHRIGMPVKEIHHKNKSHNFTLDMDPVLYHRIKDIYQKDFNLFYPEKSLQKIS